MADLQHHRILTVSALAERDQARDELFNDLMAMSPEERSKVSPDLFARLTESQLISLMGGEPKAGYPPFPTPADDYSKRTIRPSRKMKPRPPFLMAVAGALAVMVVSGGGGIFSVMFGSPILDAVFPIVRPVYARLWPQCHRLDQNTDGCVYRVETGLSLHNAAALLDVSETALRSVNTTIPAHSSILPAGTPIIVWRDRGTFTH